MLHVQRCCVKGTNKDDDDDDSMNNKCTRKGNKPFRISLFRAESAACSLRVLLTPLMYGFGCLSIFIDGRSQTQEKYDDITNQLQKMCIVLDNSVVLHTCIHTHIHTYILTYMYVSIYVCICVYICVCVYICMSICMYIKYICVFFTSPTTRSHTLTAHL